MDSGIGRGEAWAQLIRDVIASWRLAARRGGAGIGIHSSCDRSPSFEVHAVRLGPRGPVTQRGLGRDTQPSAAIVDSQSRVRSGSGRAPRGFDGGKKINDSK
ncbi:MAG: hypothetical protein ACRDTC_25790 [Pseudonocardiaceae bacterium]